MMSNSNYSIVLQRLKPVHTAYCGLHNLAENWSWTRDVNGRDREVCLPRSRHWQFFSRRDRDETLVRLETDTLRPRTLVLHCPTRMMMYAAAPVL